MATDSLGQLTVDLVANTGGFERGMDRAERKLKSTERAFKRQEAAADALVGSIDPVVGAMNRLVKQQAELEKHAKAGIIPQGEFQRLNTILNQQLDSLKSGNAELAKTGLTAKQTAAALRGVPAQFTDIATSLAAGQNPLQVFLQQGGQLKDMFGGAGPAARALGGYVLGLVNPFTLAAGAAAVLALAYKQGSDEASAFTKAIVLSGNAAGATRDQLATSARSVSESVGTVGAASEVLAALAQNGDIAAGSFDRIAIAALKMESATGKSVDETVKEFARLAKDPVNASRELNEQLNYLTAAQYEQIAATQEQGDALGAAALAEQAYSSALTQRADEIKANLGSIESAWAAVKTGAKDAWDAILDIGRESTLQEKLQEAFDTLNNATSQRGRPGRAQGLGVETRRDAEQAEQDIIALWADVAADGEKAFNAMTDRIVNERGIKGLELLRKEYDDTATTVEKLNKRLDNLRKAQEDAMASGAWTEERQRQFERAADAIQQQIAEAQATKPTRTPRERAFSEDAGQRMLNQLREQFAVLQAQTQEADKLGAAARALVQWEQQIADIKSKETLTADQKSLLANEELITAQLKRNAGLEQEIAQRKEIQRQEEERKRLQEQTNNAADQVFQGLMTEEERIRESYDRRKELILAATNRTEEEKQAALLRLQEDTDEKLLDANAGYWEKWLAAAEESLTSFDDLSKAVIDNFTGKVGSAFESIVFDSQSLEDAFYNLADGMARAVVNALGQMAAQWLAYQLVQLAVGKSAQSAGVTALIANAQATSAQAALAAFASTAAIPIVGPGLAPAAAAAATAATIPLVAAVTASATAGLAGMAHDGIDAVPQTGTWLLEKGERVTTAQTSAKLDSTLNDIRAGQGRGNTYNISLPGVTNAREGREAAAAVQRGIARGVAGSGRYA